MEAGYDPLSLALEDVVKIEKSKNKSQKKSFQLDDL